jgi:hypothetical protein
VNGAAGNGLLNEDQHYDLVTSCLRINQPVEQLISDEQTLKHPKTKKMRAVPSVDHLMK